MAIKQEGSRRTYASVPLPLLLHIAWRNLTFKRLRALLTIFGVVIGIGAIFFLLSFGIGLQHLVTHEVVGNSSVKSIDITSSNPKFIKLNDDSVNKIKHLPHVVEAGVSHSFPGSLKLSGSSVDGIVYGVDSDYLSESNLVISHGKTLDFKNDKEALIDQAVLDSMGVKDYKSVLGKKIVITSSLSGSGSLKSSITNTYTLVGVINDVGGSEVYVPDSVFRRAGASDYTQMKLLASDSDSVEALRAQIESLGFATSSPIDTVDQINQIFKFFNIILVGFGAIGMVVAVLGMFNTLTISLLERTKEIGLMMALGGRRKDMRKLFFFEAILLSVVGATVGIILAIIAGKVINIVMNIMAHRRGVTGSFNLFATPWWLILGSISFMVLVGMAVVYFPARHAEQTDPIDALRRE
ncbi:MAG: ABC transporter permease [Candidatus Saccharimonadales bacterium]